MERVNGNMTHRETTVFNGVLFYRYPSAKSPSNRYFKKTIWVNKKYKTIALHQEVWKLSNGAIPKGYCIHHKDGDITNNDISNLELLDKKKHLTDHRISAWSRPESRRKMHAWHLDKDKKSLVTKTWMSKARNNEKLCPVCQIPFLTFSNGMEAGHCSKKCRARAYYLKKLEKQCVA